jgi:hypothetical protein
MSTVQPVDPDELSTGELVSLGGSRHVDADSAAALSYQNEYLRQSIALFDRLTTTALAGADVSQIAQALSTSLGQAVVVLDADFEAIAAAGLPGADAEVSTGPRATGGSVPLLFESDDPRFRQALETAALKHLPLRLPQLPGSHLPAECILAPIAQGDDVLGFLAVTTDRGALAEDLDLFNVQHAASIFALALLQEHRDEEMRARYKRELVEGLFLGQPSRSRAAELAILVGLVPDVPYWVVALAPIEQADDVDDEEGSLLAELARTLDEREPGVVAVPRQGHVALLVAGLGTAAETDIDASEDDGAPTLAAVTAELRTFLARRFPGREFVLGASTRVPDPSDLGPAIEQAQRAMAVAGRLHVAGGVLSYADLGVHRLLLHVPEGELRAFADDIVGTLIAYDEAHRAQLVETLRAYLDERENLRRTAQRMIVHVNTVAYRIRRIEQITGFDLTDARQRLVVQVALEASRLLEPEGLAR